MRRICLLVLAVGALSLPASAGAKEIMGVKVCGASGCKALTGADALKPFFMEENARETFKVPIGTYYTVETTVGDNGQVMGTQTSFWLAEPGLMHGSEQSSYDPWWQVSDEQNAALKAAAEGIAPFAPDLARVLVGGKAVADPNSYIRLFGYFPQAFRAAPKGSRWIQIRVRPAHPNPWVQAGIKLRYQPQRRLLQRGDYDTVMLPKAVGSLLVKRASLAAVKSGSGGGHMALYAGVGAGAAVLTVLAVFRRKRMH